MALPAHSTDLTEDQQVMNAQATGPGVLEGETRGPDYGAAGHQLPNGVARPEPSPVSLGLELTSTGAGPCDRSCGSS